MSTTAWLELWKKKSALASLDVYQNNLNSSTVGSLEYFNETSLEQGLALAIFYDSSSNTLSVTFRGTEKESSMDWYSDLPYGENQYTKNFSAIQSALSDAMGNHTTANVVFTGHSLGGMLAQHAAVDFADDVKAATGGDVALITYDAPPIASTAGSSSDIDVAQHYYVEGSVVPMLGNSTYVGGTETSIHKVSYANVSGIGNLHDMATLEDVIATGDTFGSAGNVGFVISTGTGPASVSSAAINALQSIISGNGNDTDLFEQEAGLRLVDAILQGLNTSSVAQDIHTIAKAVLPLDFLVNIAFNKLTTFSDFYDDHIKDNFRSFVNSLDLPNEQDLTYSSFMSQANASAPTNGNEAVTYWLFLNMLLPNLHSLGVKGFKSTSFSKENIHDYILPKIDVVADDYTGFSDDGSVQLLLGLGSTGENTFSLASLLDFYNISSRIRLGGDGDDNLFTLNDEGAFLHGGSGDDIISGNDGDDSLIGGSNNDIIKGGDGADEVYGGDDDIIGGYGIAFNQLDDGDADVLNGGLGDDRIYADAFDSIDGGEGYDTLTMASSSTGTTSIDMDSLNVEAFRGMGSYAFDVDASGVSGKVEISTLGGNDTITTSSSGNDTVSTGSGADQITLSSGYDVIRGGGGADTYIWSGAGFNILDESTSGNHLKFENITKSQFESFISNNPGSVFIKANTLVIQYAGKNAAIKNWDSSPFDLKFDNNGTEETMSAADINNNSNIPNGDEGDTVPTLNASDLFTPESESAEFSKYNDTLKLLTGIKHTFAYSTTIASPIVLDLDSDGVSTTGLSDSSTFFDLDSNGFATQTGWISSTDGLLAIDLNSNGEIDNSTELYSVDGVNNTIDIDTYDTNTDGKLNASDTDWANIKMWVDANQNGFTESGELKTLSELNITELDLSFTSTDTTQNGNWVGYTGSFTMNGNTEDMADVWFATDQANSHYVGDFIMDWNTLSLPTLRGYGVMADLHIAMNMDSTLKAMVETLISDAEVNGSYNKENFIDMLYQWAGMSAVEQQSRSELTFLEHILNTEYADYRPGPASVIIRLFDNYVDTAIYKFEAQTIYSTDLSYDLFSDAVITSDGRIYDGFILSDFADLDFLSSAGSNDTLLGSSSAETLDAYGGDDYLQGYEGDDDLNGGTGNDTYYFSAGDGNDVIYDNGGVDQIVFDDSISMTDIEYNRINNNGTDALQIKNTSTNETIIVNSWFNNIAQNSIEQIKFSDGTIHSSQDILNSISIQSGTASNDILSGFDDVGNTLNGLVGNDELNGDDQNDSLTGGTGNDELNGGAGNDAYYFSSGDGNDIVYDNNGIDQIIFDNTVSASDIEYSQIKHNGGQSLKIENTSTGETIIVHNHFQYSSNIIEEVKFSDGTIHTSDYILNMVSYHIGDSADNTIEGFDTYDDTLYGNEGNDELSGLDGDDHLIGGTGNDDLLGGSGDDTYYFSANDGNDYIQDSSGINTIIFDSSVDVSDIQYVRGGSQDYDLLLNNISTGETITVDNWFYSSNYQISEIKFADGTIHLASDINTFISTHTGTSNADTLTGSTNLDNTMSGLEGNDTMTGQNGNDSITGGTGNDTLNGGTGGDTYYFAMGDGVDTITDSSGVDSITFDSSVDETDIIFSQSGNNLVLTVGIGGDQITINNWFTAETNQIESFDFDSGFSLPNYFIPSILAGNGTIPSNLAPFVEDVQVSGSEIDSSVSLNLAAPVDLENDTLTITVTAVPSSTNGTITLADGVTTVAVNDTLTSLELQGLLFEPISGQTGTFTFSYSVNDGTSTVTADADILITSSNPMTGTSGADTITGTSGADYIQGLEGNDNLYGNNGNDIIIGGTGNDSLRGYANDDTYIFSAGDGNDIIYETSGNDTIIFDNTVAVTDIQYVRGGSNNYDLLIQNTTTDETITVDDWFSTSPDIIETIQFDDGTVHNQAFVTAAVAQQTGTSGNDTIYGFNDYDDTLNGGAGNDNIYAFNGNDHITGGTGDDTLRGYAGDDTFYFSAGDGNDIILETAGNDAIVFDNTVAVSDIQYVRGGSNNYDLLIQNTTTGEAITVDDWFSTSPDIIESIQFDDGTVHNQAFVTAAVAQQTGTSGNDTIYGFNDYDDTLNGGAGNDNIYGYNGDDLLIGGTGDDTLHGYAGDDYLQGDGGNDTLSGDDGSDTLDGGLGVDILNGDNGDDFLYYDANDSIIDGDAGSDTLIIASNGSATSINLGQSNLYQLEALDMRDGDSDDSISLDVSEILSVSDTGIFTVFGDAGDDVTSNDTWTRGSDTTIDGNNFATYTSGTASLNIMLGLNFNSVEVEAL